MGSSLTVCGASPSGACGSAARWCCSPRVLIGIDVLMRKFLDRSIGGADELAGYALAIGTAWGLGAALLDRAHIRIDSLYVLFPQLLRLALDLAGLVLFVGFFGLIAVARLRRRLAVVDLGLAQPVRAGDPDGDPAGAVDRRPRPVRRGRALLLILEALGSASAGDSARRGAADQHALRRGRGRGGNPRRCRIARPAEATTMLGTTLLDPASACWRWRSRSRPASASSACRCRRIYSKLPLSLAMGEIAWSTSNNFLLVAIPFFVLLGEILLRSGMAERMYNALVLWVPWLPGGLMHSNIAACAMFAATSGSSVATAATIGTVAMGEIEKRGYSERLFLGTIAAGGTLGILIPPSINMIVYGVLTDTSIPKLYLAGFIPGLVLAGLFSLTVLVICLIKPSTGRHADLDQLERSASRALPDLIPPLVIFLAVIGSIYAGWATATESAALGVIAAHRHRRGKPAADAAHAAAMPSKARCAPPP